jgi:hypothetical protein
VTRSSLVEFLMWPLLRITGGVILLVTAVVWVPVMMFIMGCCILFERRGN